VCVWAITNRGTCSDCFDLSLVEAIKHPNRSHALWFSRTPTIKAWHLQSPRSRSHLLRHASPYLFPTPLQAASSSRTGSDSKHAVNQPVRPSSPASEDLLPQHAPPRQHLQTNQTFNITDTCLSLQERMWTTPVRKPTNHYLNAETPIPKSYCSAHPRTASSPSPLPYINTSRPRSSQAAPTPPTCPVFRHSTSV
jgi:hypothetical protein